MYASQALFQVNQMKVVAQIYFPFKYLFMKMATYLYIFYLGQTYGTTTYGKDELIKDNKASVDVGTVLVFSGLYQLVCGTSTDFMFVTPVWVRLPQPPDQLFVPH